MKAWLRALMRWLEGGNWHSFDVDHCCAGCEATTRRIKEAVKWLDDEWLPQFAAEGERLDQLIADYQRKQAPVREMLPIDDTQRALEIAVLEEWRTR